MPLKSSYDVNQPKPPCLVCGNPVYGRASVCSRNCGRKLAKMRHAPYMPGNGAGHGVVVIYPGVDTADHMTVREYDLHRKAGEFEPGTVIHIHGREIRIQAEQKPLDVAGQNE